MTNTQETIMYYELTSRSETLIFTNTDGLRTSNQPTVRMEENTRVNQPQTTTLTRNTHLRTNDSIQAAFRRRWRHLPARIHTELSSLLLLGFISVVTIEVIFLTKKQKTSRTSSLTKRYKEFNEKRNHEK